MELEINGYSADLGTAIIAISRAAIDIDNLSLKKIDITNSFNLPKTQTNNQIFNSPYVINSNNTSLDSAYPAKLIDQFFIFNGKGFLKELASTYKFQLAEKSKEFFNDLNQDIKCLDFEADDFPYNTTSYNSLKLLSNSVFVWSIICQHEKKLTANTLFASGTAKLKFTRPLFRFKTILDKIFTSRGWTLEYDEELLDQLAITSNAEQFFVTSYQKTLSGTYVISGSYTLTGLDTYDFYFSVVLTSTTIDIGNIKTAIRLRGGISCTAEIKITVKADNGTDVTSEEFYINQDTTELDITTSEFESDTGNNYISIEFEGTGSVTFDDTLLYTIIEEQNLGNFSDNNLVGYRVKAYDNLPEIDQIDIFKDALVLMNGIIKPDSLNSKIVIKSLKNTNRLKSYDWSAKVNEKSEKITPFFGNYGRTNYLQYDNDETIDSIIGRNFFQINNDSLKESHVAIEMRYSASREVTINSYIMADMNIYSDTERLNELNDRLLYVYNDPTDTFTVARFSQLDWTNLKDNYYDKFFDSLSRPRIITVEMNLNKLDVLGFDFLKLVYIEYFKSYFYVLSIDDFVPNELTKVKLLKFM